MTQSPKLVDNGNPFLTVADLAHSNATEYTVLVIPRPSGHLGGSQPKLLPGEDSIAEICGREGGAQCFLQCGAGSDVSFRFRLSSRPALG